MTLSKTIRNDLCVVIMQALTFARQDNWKAATERLQMALYILTGAEDKTEKKPAKEER